MQKMFSIPCRWLEFNIILKLIKPKVCYMVINSNRKFISFGISKIASIKNDNCARIKIEKWLTIKFNNLHLDMSPGQVCKTVEYL